MSSTTDNQRINFASIKSPIDYPDFLEVQLKSFQDFLQLDTPPEKRKNEGLYKVFSESFPITDTRNNFVLEFIDYYVDPPRYTIEECIERGLTYSVPLKAKLKLYCTDPDHEDFETKFQDVYLGAFPYMTPKGTFVVNGAERNCIAVTSVHWGILVKACMPTGRNLFRPHYSFKGSWIIRHRHQQRDVMTIDREEITRNYSIACHRFETDKDILEIFNLAEEIK